MGIYTCVCVCTYIRVWVYTCEYVYTSLLPVMGIYTCVACVCACIYIIIYTYAHIQCISWYTHMHHDTCHRMCVHTHTHTHSHTHTHTLTPDRQKHHVTREYMRDHIYKWQTDRQTDTHTERERERERERDLPHTHTHSHTYTNV